MISAYPQNQYFNPYQNTGWNPYQQSNPYQVPQTPVQQPPMQTAPPSTGGIDGVAFVQGENAALAFVVPAGKTFLLIDTMEDRIYFKSADSYGRPSPLNDFWLTKSKPVVADAPAEPEKAQTLPEYATKQDLEDIREQIAEIKARRVAKRKKSDIIGEAEVEE